MVIRAILKHWRAIFLVLLVGILLGILWTVFYSQRVGNFTNNEVEDVPVFGELFTLFVIGRTGRDMRYTADAPIVPGDTFATRERVGLRIQTASGVSSSIPVELRLVTADTKEETSSLESLRQRFTITPGLRTYCCITMPDEPQTIEVRILVRGHFIGSLRSIRVQPPLNIQHP